MHQEFLGRRLTATIGFQTRDSRFKSGRPSQIWKVARGGAQLVLKTRPSNALEGSTPSPSAKLSEPPAVAGGHVFPEASPNGMAAVC
ncbi:MAG: hypothetical protein QOH70_169 [Blastocatellia bacterium]|nr:hypothetical protein [Blastocatellia bacterium]